MLRTRDADAKEPEVLYALQDETWDIIALCDGTGTIVERFLYDPYGRSKVLEPNFTNDSDGASDYDWDYRFTTQEWDSETALHYFNARYYHDGLGRFVGRDPLGYVDGKSLYAAYFVPGGADPKGKSTLGFSPIEACIIECQDSCYEKYQNTSFWQRSLLSYRFCTTECERECGRQDPRSGERRNLSIPPVPSCPCFQSTVELYDILTAR